MPSSPSLTLRRLFAGILLSHLVGFSVAHAQSDLDVPEAQLPQLDRLIQEAISQAPRMLLRNANAAAAEANLLTAKSARLPTVGASASWVASNEDRGDFAGAVPADKLYYSFVVNQPLYQWGNIKRSIESAEIRKAMDEGRTRQAYLLVANEVREKYLNLVRQRRYLESSRFNLKLANQALAEGRVKRAQNIVSDADIFQAELHQQRADLVAMRGEDSFIYDSEVLGRLSGTAPLSPEEVPLDFPSPNLQHNDPMVAALVSRFLSADTPANTEMDLAVKQMEISENDLLREKTALRPNVSLTAGATLDEQSYDLNIANKYEVKSLYAGVSMTWSIFDGFATKGRIRASLARMRAAEVNFDVKKSEIRSNVSSYGRQFKSLGLAILITDRELDSAKNSLADMKERLKRGEVSDAHVNASESSLHSAYSKALSERATYWDKLGSLLKIIEADPVLNRVGQ